MPSLSSFLLPPPGFLLLLHLLSFSLDLFGGTMGDKEKPNMFKDWQLSRTFLTDLRALPAPPRLNRTWTPHKIIVLGLLAKPIRVACRVGAAARVRAWTACVSCP